MKYDKFWQNYKDTQNMLKQAFIQMPGGQDQNKQAQDPSMGGMPPPGMDPAAMGAMPPGADPAVMGMMPPPGMDPSMGLAPAGDPAGAMTPPAAPGSPMITISLDQLFEIIQKVLGLAKKVGVNGAGVQQPAAEATPGITADQLKSTIYEALGSMAG